MVKSALRSSKSAICIDTETNYTDNLDQRYCLGIAIATKDQYFYIPVGHKPIIESFVPKNVEVPLDLLDEITCDVVFHNAKFDLAVLRKMGLRYKYDRIFDTMLMAHYIQEDRGKGKTFSLEYLAAEYCTDYQKDVGLAKIMKVGWETTPISAMAEYAKMDVLATLELFHELWFDYEEYNEACWDTFDKRFMYVCLDIEFQGIRIDKVKCKEFEDLCRMRMAEISQELGFDPAKNKQVQAKLFGSPPEGLGIEPKYFTKTGPQVDVNALSEINHPIAGLILEYRANSKQAGSYFGNYLDNVGEGDRLHPTFKLHGTTTGRTSCELPNMQQIPRDSPVKGMFLPEEGYQLWEVDFNNLEMRLTAVYSNCLLLLKVFKEEGDVHQQAADLAHVTRQVAKILNFLITYGGGADALSFQIKIAKSEAAKIIALYKKEYHEVFTAMKRAHQVADSHGEIKLFSGRKRHFRWPSEHRKAFNAVIQGGGFEIVKRSMILLDDAGFDIRNQVHDSVWLNVQKESEVIEAEHIMSDWTEEAFGLKFSVDRKRLR